MARVDPNRAPISTRKLILFMFLPPFPASLVESSSPRPSARRDPRSFLCAIQDERTDVREVYAARWRLDLLPVAPGKPGTLGDIDAGWLETFSARYGSSR